MVEIFRYTVQSLRVYIFCVAEEIFHFDPNLKTEKSFFEVIQTAYSHAIQNGNSDDVYEMDHSREARTTTAKENWCTDG